jgi:hypothetical protein
MIQTSSIWSFGFHSIFGHSKGSPGDTLYNSCLDLLIRNKNQFLGSIWWRS